MRETKSKGKGLSALSGVSGIAGTVLNKGIDLLPFEAHLPGGYRYCGPGTKLKERLARGDKGINGLDEACKDHDIAYSKYSDTTRRAQADKDLAERAWRRFKAPDSSIGERAAAWAVTTAMKAKAKLGGSHKKTPHKGLNLRPNKGHGYYLKPYKKGQGYYLKPYKGRGVKCQKKKKVAR